MTQLLSVEQALEHILNRTRAVSETETLPLLQTLNRVLAQAQQAEVDVPPADNSAMDGYAINIDDRAISNKQLPISQTIAAGTTPAPLQAATAARIFTGAEIPPGANAVVMQEHCEVTGNMLSLPDKVTRHNNIRFQGQDIKTGDRILQQGRCLQTQDIALLASVGKTCVPVYRRLRVAIVSTGSELIEPGKPLAPGQIYNANRYLLSGFLQKLGVDIIDLGCVEDNLQETEKALSQAAATADCIISTGGVSVGAEDHIKTAINNLGSLTIWRIALKPGKPLAFGEIDGTPLFGLPGNPVSAFITFLLFVRPFLVSCQGSHYQPANSRKLIANFSATANPRRWEYRRIKIDGQDANSYDNQSSGVLSSIVWADGLAVIPSNTAIKPGDKIDVISFSDLF
ncbi:MAG: molybdopterin molybdotransferase MoeA [Cellvibrionaceae bacterium]|nr:molybdopterin molybdotransferase MoeA [Cellvibrionaceae bacterium]